MQRSSCTCERPSLSDSQRDTIPEENVDDDVAFSEASSSVQENGAQSPAVKLGERGYYVEGHLVSASADFGRLVEKTDTLENFPGRSERDVVKVRLRH